MKTQKKLREHYESTHLKSYRGKGMLLVLSIISFIIAIVLISLYVTSLI